MRRDLADDDLLEIDLEHSVFGRVCCCGKPKGKYQSFCGPCTLLLPEDLRYELWRPFKGGYASDWARARDWLVFHVYEGTDN